VNSLSTCGLATCEITGLVKLFKYHFLVCKSTKKDRQGEVEQGIGIDVSPVVVFRALSDTRELTDGFPDTLFLTVNELLFKFYGNVVT
jgi:hypothetical protein